MFRFAIVGRPNVGKSSIFNAIIKKKDALVHDMPGVTRDRLEGITTIKVRNQEMSALLIDTGGLGGPNFDQEIRDQVKVAIDQADAVLWVLDAQVGLTSQDREIMQTFRKGGVFKKKVIGLWNKVDDDIHFGNLDEAYEMGLDAWVAVSAEHRRGFDDLNDILFELFKDHFDGERIEPKERPTISIIGKPNVGKSTLTNALVKSARVITSNIPGTTVDSIDTLAWLNELEVILVDTAGIRKKSKTEQGVEVLSVLRSKRAIERSDLVFFVVDGKEGVTEQDEKIAGMAVDAGVGVIILVNKWDLQIANPDFNEENARDIIRKNLPFLSFAPIFFISALKEKGIDSFQPVVEKILADRDQRIVTRDLTELAKSVLKTHNPKGLSILFAHQTSKRPPTFVFHVNNPEKVHFSVEGALVNKIRAEFGYIGLPIRMIFRKKTGNAANWKLRKKSPSK